MTSRLWYNTLLMLCCPFMHLWGQISFQARVSRNTMGLDETLQVTFTLSQASEGHFTPPDFTGWSIVTGPAITTTGTLINGVKSIREEYVYTLKPLQKGKGLILPARVEVNGQSYESNRLLIEITDPKPVLPTGNAETDASGFAYDAYVLDSEEDAREKISRNLFLKIKLNKSSCYEGESIVADYLLYSRVNLSARVDKRPAFPGFSTIDLPTGGGEQYDLIYEGGKTYRVFTLRKVQLTPLQSGVLRLQPMTLDARVLFMRMKNGRPVGALDPYTPDKTEEVAFSLSGQEVAVNVLPLPVKGRPPGDVIPVGRFTRSIRCKRPEMSAGQNGELEIQVEGMGQWSLIPAPVINWPKGVTGFDPVVEEKLDSQSVPVKGVRIYRYRFSADSAAVFTLNTADFSFFDPWKEVYQRLPALSLRLNISPAMPSADQSGIDAGASGYLQEDISLTALFTRFVPVLAVSLALILGLYAFRQWYRTRSLQRIAPGMSDETAFGLQPDNGLDFSTRPEITNALKEVKQPLPTPDLPEAYAVAVDQVSLKELAKQYLRETERIIRQKTGAAVPVNDRENWLMSKGIAPQDAQLYAAWMAECEALAYAPEDSRNHPSVITLRWEAIRDRLMG